MSPSRCVQTIALVLALLAGATSLASAEPLRFDEARAFRELAELVALGPRTVGSEGNARARTLIRERLRQAGWVVETRVVSAEPGRKLSAEVANLLAKKERPAAPIILLITHFDSKALASGGTPAANTSASGVAVLLELSRQLANGLPGTELWLAFCDGSEPIGAEISSSDGLRGSRELARELELDGTLSRVAAVIYVQMVGDRDLKLSPGQPRSNRLAMLFARAAGIADDPRLVDMESSFPVVGDHQPFRKRGVGETLAVVDYWYGPGPPPGELRYSAQDVLAAVSAQSLGRSGRTLMEFLRLLDADLANRPSRKFPP